MKIFLFRGTVSSMKLGYRRTPFHTKMYRVFNVFEEKWMAFCQNKNIYRKVFEGKMEHSAPWGKKETHSPQRFQ